MKTMYKSLVPTAVALFALLAASCSKNDNNPTPPAGNPVTAIQLSNVTADGITLGGASPAMMTVQVSTTPSNADDAAKYYYDYYSTNTRVFIVNDKGILTAVGPGEATLRVTAKNNADVYTACTVKSLVNATTAVTIAAAAKPIAMTVTTGGTIYSLKQYVSVTPSTATPLIRFTSSNPGVATVDYYTGDIKAIWEGTATIRAEVLDGSGLYDETTVNVSTVKATSISVYTTYQNLSIEVPATSTLTVGTGTTSPIRLQPTTVSRVGAKFTSSNPDIASVDPNTGVITSKKTGTVTITVETIDGSNLSTTCTVNSALYDYGTALSRTGWSVTSSPYADVATNGLVGTPASLIDNSTLPTALCLLKVNATYGGKTGPTANPLYFTVDMGQSTSFNYFNYIQGTVGISDIYYRASSLLFFGSDDGTNFTQLGSSILISSGTVSYTKLKLAATYTYRYVKVQVNPYTTSTSYPYVAIQDFQLGKYVLVP